jgi:hypothetical protein
MFKRQVSVLVLLAALAVSVPAWAYSDGSGTSGNPYQLASKADLLQLAATPADYALGKCFVMTADIDLAGQTFTTAVIAPDIDPVADGFQGTPFGAQFSGGGHRITGLTIDATGTSNDYLGLFGRIGEYPTISNIVIENCSIVGGIGSDYVGPIAGQSTSGTIRQCGASGNVTGGAYVGGIVGAAAWNIYECNSSCAVTGTIYCGGIAGTCDYMGNSYSTGMVTADDYAGGICGSSSNGTVFESYSTGKVVCPGTHSGGLLGNRLPGSVTNCFWDMDTSERATSAGGIGKTTAEMKDIGTFTGATWDFVGETLNGTGDIWQSTVGAYPIHAWQRAGSGIVFPPTYSVASGPYLSPKTVSIGCYTAGVAIHYTTNGAEPAESDPSVSNGGSIILNEGCTLKARAYGTGLTPSAVSEASYTLTVSTPVFSVASGTYPSPRHVKVTCALTTATIHYTTNGAIPTESDPVVASGDSVYVASDLTLQAKAWAPGATESGVQSATYTIVPGWAYSGGTGTLADPYLIMTRDDIVAIGPRLYDYDKHFLMIADVDMSGTTFTTALIAPDTSSTSGFQGTAFTGTFNGAGHRITGLAIDATSSPIGYLGLFGSLGACGHIRGVRMENCSITGSTTMLYTGSLVGVSTGGTIEECSSSGTVTGGQYTGGLAGYNNPGWITKCSSSANVTGEMYDGGLAGGNNGGTIALCYATGNVAGTFYAGGLVGNSSGPNSNNYGYITDSYARGAVTSGGGLVGMANTYGNIFRCYSTGAVSGPAYSGGLIGNGNGGIVTGCFWDTQTSGKTTSWSGSGRTTAQMQNILIYSAASWDFAAESVTGLRDYWKMPAGGGYPELAWQSGAPGGIVRVPKDYSTVQAAIDAASAGDEVVISPGTYTGTGNVELNFKGKAITVRSTNPDDPAVVAGTLLDLGARGFLFTNGEGPMSIVSGLNIYRGNYGMSGSDYYGVEVKCTNSSPTIRKCILYYAGWSNGFYAVGLTNSSATFADCTIQGNNGGIYISGGSPTIERCVLTKNSLSTSSYILGSAHCINTSLLVRDCFLSNDGYPGSTYYAFYATSSKVTIQNCTLKKNAALYGSASQYTIANSILLPAGANPITLNNGSTLNMSYCASASTVTKDGSSTANYGDGNFTPPAGISFGALGHIDVGSIYMNAGDPAYVAAMDEKDLSGNPRVVGGRIDIGCCEVPAKPTVLSPKAGEVVSAGSHRTIRWTSASAAVDIFYSLDGGTNWMPIATGQPGSGTFEWTTPLEVSLNCLVAVDGDGDAQRGLSGVFALKPYQPGTTTPSNWPTLSGGQARRGLSPFVGPETGCRRIQIPINTAIYGGVVTTADGLVYWVSGQSLYWFRENSETLDVHQAPLPAAAASAPSLGPDGSIYVGLEDGRLVALDAEGNAKWSVQTGGIIAGSPAVANDGRVFAGSMDGTLRAFGADGSELWVFTAPGGTSLGFFASPTFGPHGSLYAADISKAILYALNPDTGAINWQADFSSDGIVAPGSTFAGRMMAAPAVRSDGIFYLAFDAYKYLYAVNPDGSCYWAFDLTDNASGLYEPFGTATTPQLSGYSWSEPVVGPDGTIYASTDDPYVRAIDASGTLKWATRCGTQGGFTLSVGADGLVYACSDDKSMYVIRPDGTLAAVLNGTGWLSYPVVGRSGSVYVSDSAGILWAFGSSCGPRARDIRRIWDVDGSGMADFVDFAIMAADWTSTASGRYMPGDTNRDAVVDFKDVMMIAEMWLAEEVSSQ